MTSRAHIIMWRSAFLYLLLIECIPSIPCRLDISVCYNGDDILSNDNEA